MATLLARLKVRAGMEARWETMMAELVDNTLAHETGVIRYEYWKGQEPRTWYGLLSFVSKLAFFTHQDAPYHRDQPYGDCIEDMHLEWLDPVDGASPLPHTTDSPLPADTPDNLREWENRSPIQVADWWAGKALTSIRKQTQTNQGERAMATRIIISGTIDMPPENVAPALESARPLIEGALTEPGCLDYDWCPDPRIPGRIRVFERWESEESLANHFQCEWYTNMRGHLGAYGITGAVTAKYRVDLEEPVYDNTGTARADFFTAS